MATITITVTVAGGKFVLDGVSQATYSATPGNTYKFDQSDGPNGTHPLILSTTSDGTHNSGSAYTTGVTTSGTPGSGGAYTQIEVTATTVQSLFYYCSSHSGMGGAFNVGSSETVQYQQRAGFAVQNRTTDPVPYAQALVNNPYTGAWASGTSVNSARRSMASAGIQTASIITGGLLPPGTAAITEQWNGSAWTEVADLNTGRWYFKGDGTSTAGIVFGGMESDPTASAKTELWNGSGWTETGDLNTARQKMGNSTRGTTTASIAFGGSPADPAGGGALSITESWNGSAWTEVNDLNTARKGVAGSGTNTAALAIAGNIPPVSPLNESWNGSSWTEVGDLNTGREQGGSAGTQTSAIYWSGYPDSPGVLTESWNGSALTEVADLANKQIASGSAGVSNESAAAIAGYNGTANVATVEDWSFSGLPPSTPVANYSESVVGDLYYNTTEGSFKAIKSGGAPIGTWASGGTMNNDERYFSGGAGTKTAAIAFGGEAPKISKTELYDGSSWTEVANLNAAKSYVAGSGTNTAALCMQGDLPPVTNQVESWNGSSWTEITDTNLSKNAGNTACGTQTATLLTMRISGPAAYTEIWNGSAWTEVNDMNTAREGGGVAGISTSSIAAGGATVDNAESWDGTSWTEVSEINTARQSLGSSGAVNTSAIIFAGNRPGGSSPLPGNQSSPYTESWDGSSWTEVADLGNARYGGSSSKSGGTSLSAHAAGGYSGTAYTGITEEWSADDFEIKTVTTS